MRLSIKLDDPGFGLYAKVHERADICILLDGIDITTKCFTVDTESGEAFCYVKDEKGLFVLNDSGTEVLTEKLTGNVEVILTKKVKG